MKIIPIVYPKENENYNNELLSVTNDGITTSFGTVFLKKGARIPETGFSRHPFNEVSIITKGCIEMINEANEVIGYLKAGTAVYLNAGEPQAGFVKEDTEIIYVLNQPA
jgi:quercetin dioxygenase-like cupin family protein